MGREALLRRIPQVERVLQESLLREALSSGSIPRPPLVEAVRGVLEERRRALLAGGAPDLDPAEIAREGLGRAREATAPRLVRVVNATGIVLHTNLGRAPLAEEAVRAAAAAAGYCNLEYDLARGVRGDRHAGISVLLRELTGAEAGLVVNNNAAAVLLALAALARGRDVLVSRGELVEIGGAFRIPEVMAQSGATLREVGTTNRTYLRDYEAAVGPDTGLLLKVHTSNYRIQGFTAEVSLRELAGLGRKTGLPVMEDLGSGCFVDLSRGGAAGEPTVGDAVATGADLVTFSGDKLLGGPQAGLLVGRREAVEACARHPLMRALRPDKLTLAALEATLSLYRDSAHCLERVPALRALLRTPEELEARARRLAALVGEQLAGWAEVAVGPDVSEAGGGALPTEELPTWVVEIRRSKGGLQRLEEELRRGTPPVVARIREDALVLDVRTLETGEDELVSHALRAAAARLGSGEEEPPGPA